MVAKEQTDVMDDLQRGITLQQNGRKTEAEGIYTHILKKDPNNINALNLLGVIASDRKDYRKSVELIGRAIRLQATHANLHVNLGVALQGLGKFKEAQQSYSNALKIHPNDPKAHYNLGVVLQTLNMFSDAIISYHKAIKFNPTNALAYNNIGIIHQERGRYDDAIINYKQALVLMPNSFATYNNLGACYKQGTRDLKTALRMFEKSIALNSKHASSWNNLGNTYKDLGELAQALEALKKAGSIDNENAEIKYNTAAIYELMGNIDQAMQYYKQALEINPDHNDANCKIYHIKRQLCDWLHYEELNTKLNKRLDNNPLAETPFSNVLRKDSVSVNQKVAKAWSYKIEQHVRNCSKNFSFLNRRQKKSKINIGYLSADFHDHATAHLMAGIFQHHDKKKFNINCYSYGIADDSIYRQDIMQGSDKFFDIANHSDVEAARNIYQDNIDILVDLKGHTRDNRLEIAALKPAPIQVTYLGFPGTSGADFFDYIITDKIVTPNYHAQYYNEALAYLPNCYQVTNNKQKISESIFTKESFGIPEDAFVLSCFNQSYKLDPEFMTIWANILGQTKNTVLWLYESNEDHKRYINRFLHRCYISPDRIFYAKKLPKDQHLARLALVDLAIDTRIYNGHTTTSDALWAGVPVITLEGDHFASRVSSSILQAIDLPDCITYVYGEYEKKILDIIENPKILASLKKKLANKRLTSTLFNTEQFTKDIESLYNKMWSRYVANKGPTDIELT